MLLGCGEDHDKASLDRGQRTGRVWGPCPAAQTSLTKRSLVAATEAPGRTGARRRLTRSRAAAHSAVTNQRLLLKGILSWAARDRDCWRIGADRAAGHVDC